MTTAGVIMVANVKKAKRKYVRTAPSKWAGKFSLGQKFGEWEVVDEMVYMQSDTSSHREAHIQVKCSCGTIKKITALSLVRGTSALCFRCGMNSQSGSGNPRWKGGTYVPGYYYSQLGHKTDHDVSVSLNFVDTLYKDQGMQCSLTGLPLAFPSTSARDASVRSLGNASLDRIDSSQGYVSGNVQWLHKAVNNMKGALPQDAFISLCHLVAEHNPNPPNVDLSNVSWGGGRKPTSTLDFFNKREHQ